MEQEEVGIDDPVEVDGVTLIPVVKISSHHWHTEHGISFLGVKQAIAVVVVHPGAKRIFRITGEEVPLDQLSHEFPSAKGILERL